MATENNARRHGFGKRLWIKMRDLQSALGVQISGNAMARRNTEMFVRFLEYRFRNRRGPIQIASKAFIDHVQHKQHNIVSDFKSTGLYSPSIDMMIRRLEKFNSPGTKRGDTLGSETWLQIRHEVRTEVIILPPKRVRIPHKRTTVDVGGRLLTWALLATDQRKHPDTIRDCVGCTDVVI